MSIPVRQSDTGEVRRPSPRRRRRNGAPSSTTSPYFPRLAATAGQGAAQGSEPPRGCFAPGRGPCPHLALEMGKPIAQGEAEGREVRLGMRVLRRARRGVPRPQPRQTDAAGATSASIPSDRARHHAVELSLLAGLPLRRAGAGGRQKPSTSVSTLGSSGLREADRRSVRAVRTNPARRGRLPIQRDAASRAGSAMRYRPLRRRAGCEAARKPLAKDD